MVNQQCRPELPLKCVTDECGAGRSGRLGDRRKPKTRPHTDHALRRVVRRDISVLSSPAGGSYEEPKGPKRSRGGTSTLKPSRTGTKHIGGHFPPEVAKQLRQLAVDEDTSHQKLLGEALDLLFQSRRLPTIASK